MLSCLSPYFQGDLHAYGTTVQTVDQAPAEAIRLVTLTENPDTLRALLIHHAQNRGAENTDLRAVASSWNAGYLWALLPASLVAACLAGQDLPHAIAEIRVLCDENGRVACIYLPHEGKPFNPPSRFLRYTPLLYQHLTPLFHALHLASGISKRMLWGMVARYGDYIFEQLQSTDLPTIPVATDRLQLLDERQWPDGSANPMYANACAVKTNEGQTLRLHRQCCLWYKLPGEDYCEACPIRYGKHARL